MRFEVDGIQKQRLSWEVQEMLSNNTTLLIKAFEEGVSNLRMETQLLVFLIAYKSNSTIGDSSRLSEISYVQGFPFKLRYSFKNITLFLTQSAMNEYMEDTFRSHVIRFGMDSVMVKDVGQKNKDKIIVSDSTNNVVHAFFFTKQNSPLSQQTSPYYFGKLENKGGGLAYLRSQGNGLKKIYLRHGMTEKYPEPNGFEEDDFKRMFEIITKYKGGSSCGLNYYLWRDMYPFVYFDLRYREPFAINDDDSILIEYEMNANPTANQNAYVAPIRGVELQIKKTDDDIVASLVQ